MTATTKRFVVWGIVGGAVGLGLAVAFAPRAIPVDLVSLELAPMTVTVDEEGQTRIHDVYVLSAPVGGRVQRLVVHVGDAVVAGETVVARIEPGDPSLLDPRSEEQARAAIEAAEAAHDLAAAQVEEATAQLAFAESTLRRLFPVVGTGAISEMEYDQAIRDRRTSAAALETARAALQMRQFELEQARAQLLSPTRRRPARPDCECVPITAPVSGRVLTIVSASERVVVAGDPLLEIGDPVDLEIAVDFLSADAVKVTPGQRVVIDGWGGDRPLAGRVRTVEPFGFTKVSALGIEEQRVNVIVDLDDPPDRWSRLGHGYQVETRVVLWESDGVLAVPLTALFRDGLEWAVFAERSGRARLTHVEVGQRNRLAAEIVSGLVAGESRRGAPERSDPATASGSRDEIDRAAAREGRARRGPRGSGAGRRGPRERPSRGLGRSPS